MRGSKDGFFEKVEYRLRDLMDPLDPLSPEAARPARPAMPAGYRSWLQSEYAPVELLRLRLKQGQAVRLNQI